MCPANVHRFGYIIGFVNCILYTKRCHANAICLPISRYVILLQRTLLGVCIQLFNLCIFLYSFVLGLWLLLTVFYGRHMNMWSNTRKRVFEIAGHAFVWFNAILFTGLGFINQSYGQAGLWCWIRNDTDTGRLLQMLLYYVPLWIILILVTIMYIISLIHGKKQCIFIVVVAYRTFSSIRQDVSLVRIGMLTSGSNDKN